MNKVLNLQPLWPALLLVALAACTGDSDPGSADGNSPPTISGTPPQSAQVGQPWNFEPSISDPDGDPLTVTADNLPGWLALQPSTGRLQGTPGEGDVRTWSNIRLTVSDGQNSASLSAFSINVIAEGAGTGTALLSWNPPTERVDGTPIGGLSGYRILYGQQSQSWSSSIQVNGGGVTSYLVEDLGPGTWHFVVTAIATDGLESAPSQEVSKTI